MYEFAETGNSTIDLLQRAQIQAETLPTGNFRLRHFKDTVQMAGRVLLGNQLMVSAHNFFAKTPDAAPNELIFFGREMLFIAELDEYHYLADPSIPLDSLILSFERPEVVDIDPDDASAFRQLRFEVPVLAIDTCTDIAK